MKKTSLNNCIKAKDQFNAFLQLGCEATVDHIADLSHDAIWDRQESGSHQVIFIT